jgi:hypothetical protein
MNPGSPGRDRAAVFTVELLELAFAKHSLTTSRRLLSDLKPARR